MEPDPVFRLAGWLLGIIVVLVLLPILLRFAGVHVFAF